MTTHLIKAAVVTGRHAFDVPGFHALLRSIPDIDFSPQDLENYATDFSGVHSQYNAVVFYNYHQPAPSGDGPVRDVLERLGESNQGIVVWHHGLVAFLEWGYWSDVVGIQDRTFKAHVGQELHIDVANREHPITKGLAAWSIVDETYAMDGPEKDSQVLLTVDHPKSLRPVAWTRQHKRARVFCYQSGHDRRVYDNPTFRTVFARGIKWVAQRI